ncbi:MAG: hypothetical protein ABW034_03670 [Steroidobacteraceae bacterium]
MLRNTLLAIVSLTISATAAAYESQPRNSTTLEGSWVVNSAASDDVDKLVSELIDKEEKERRRWRRQMEEEDPFSSPDPLPDLSDPRYRRAVESKWRRMLGVTNTLKLHQDGARIEMSSELDARRFEAGSSSQVSMRNGDLADSRVGWDGEWFVIDRKVPRGAHELEKLRLIKSTGQLEYVIKWSGDTELSGVKLRRVFDRAASDEPAPDPAVGPAR